MTDIETVAVIGAGVMGAGIAAHAANAGARVVLLDIVEGAADAALSTLKKADPAAFVHPSYVDNIQVGTTGEDLALVGDSDWIVEAVVEKTQVKQSLYASLAPHLKSTAILSSNTSTIPLERLTDGMDSAMRRRFVITHFFNPPRYMRLLELVCGVDTDPDVVERITHFADYQMGKAVVPANDTPGFIANRIGTFWAHAAVVEAIRQGIGVEQADAVLGRPAGVPKTGVFGLLDLVGLDLMPHVLESLTASLPDDDAFHTLGPAPAFLERMIEAGYTGRKGKGGFYRLNERGEKEVVDLESGEYSLARRPQPAAVKRSRKGGLRALLVHDSAEGRYARRVLLSTLSYAASLIPEVADEPEQIDKAMRLGYNWRIGPFELIDQLGPAWLVQALRDDGLPVPTGLKDIGQGSYYRVEDGRLQQFVSGEYSTVRRAEGVLILDDVKRTSTPLFRNRSASVWDIGDNVACLEFTSRMNAIDPFTLSMIKKCVRRLPTKGFKALVVYNEGRNFSVGANIALLLIASRLRLSPVIGWLVGYGQDALDELRRAPFPVIGAPSGMALGGGCEILLHCDAITAHVESYIGLVETGVGIVPAWGGCKELLARWIHDEDRPGGPMPPIMETFETIAMAKVARSAHEARDMRFLRPIDEIVMNRDRLLARAKRQALQRLDGYQVPERYQFRLPGRTARAALELGVREFVNKGTASGHDARIARELATVLSGGDTDILLTIDGERLSRLERRAITTLAVLPKTRERIAHTLKTGKPLRN